MHLNPDEFENKLQHPDSDIPIVEPASSLLISL